MEDGGRGTRDKKASEAPRKGFVFYEGSRWIATYTAANGRGQHIAAIASFGRLAPFAVRKAGIRLTGFHATFAGLGRPGAWIEVMENEPWFRYPMDRQALATRFRLKVRI